MKNVNLAHLTPDELNAALASAAAAADEQRQRDALQAEAGNLAQLESEKQRRREINALIEQRRGHIEIVQTLLSEARTAAPAAQDRLRAAMAELDAAAAETAAVQSKIRTAAMACQRAARAQIRIDELNGAHFDPMALYQSDGGMTAAWAEAGGVDPALSLIPAEMPRELSEVVRRACGGVLYHHRDGLATFFRR